MPRRHLAGTAANAPNSQSLSKNRTEIAPMTYDHFFSAALARLREERRYRVFADLERIAGRFPHATWH